MQSLNQSNSSELRDNRLDYFASFLSLKKYLMMDKTRVG